VIIHTLANLPSSCPADSSSLESCISALKSSISALESSLKVTEGSSGHWETIGWLCAIAVGVGIAGEIVVIVSEHRDDLEDWRRGVVRPPDRPPMWRFWFDIVATLIVLGGVFGEAGATAKVASINSHLRSKTSEFRAKSDQLLAVVTQQAGNAETSATAASEASASAKSDVKTAHDEVNVIGKRAKLIDADLTTVQWLISARRIQDVDGAVADLRNGFHGRDIILKSYSGDVEGYWLCEQLVDIAKKAEMRPQDICANELMRGVPVTDLLVGAPSIEEAQKLSVPLKKPRRVEGYFAGLQESPALSVLVGVKQSFPIWPPKRLEVPASKNTENKTSKP
jgi:hypothetical protein